MKISQFQIVQSALKSVALRTGFVILAIQLLTVAPCIGQSKSFHLSGAVKGADKGKLLLFTMEGPELVEFARGELVNGRFSIKGEYNLPCHLVAKVQPDGAQFSMLMESGYVHVSFDLAKAVVTEIADSDLQDERERVEEQAAVIWQQAPDIKQQLEDVVKRYVAAEQRGASEEELNTVKNEYSKIQTQLDPYRDRVRELEREYVTNHPDSYLSASLMMDWLHLLSREEREAEYQRLSAEVRACQLGRQLRHKIDTLKNRTPGDSDKK